VTEIIHLGLGFTTRRLAKRFLLRGIPTFALVRNADRYLDLRSVGLYFNGFPKNATVIHTIPPLPPDEDEELRQAIDSLEPRRVVYISSTGVYGSQTSVDENSIASPDDAKGIRRIEDENRLRSGPWQTLIIRPAAIYGPGRGVHERILAGRAPRAEPVGITSRIHVDDLAAVLEAGALSDLTGAWPLADDLPCATTELAAWCARLLGREVNPGWSRVISVAGRAVDGRKIRDLLGVELAYPTWESGVLASLAETRFRQRPA
jgi:nucleoside-diphosphate-sugar epimerase